MPSSISSPVSPSDAPARAGIALQVRGLTGPLRAPVIHDIDLAVPRGQRLVVLGPIQSGKSTLMRHLVGLERASQGTIVIDDIPFDPRFHDEAVLRRVRARVGVVFESSALLRDLTALQNVELPILEHRREHGSAARDAAQRLLDEVGVHSPGETLPSQLDRAGQRRVALARAIALEPALLFLDEPTVGLDSNAAHEFDTAIDELQAHRGTGIVIFTHEVRFAFGGADEIVVMHRGRIVGRGNLHSLLHSEVPIVRQLLHRRGGT